MSARLAMLVSGDSSPPFPFSLPGGEKVGSIKVDSSANDVSCRSEEE